MTTVHKTALVAYSAEQMYALVNDVNAYPEFLPWCSSSRVLSQTETTLSAELTLKAGKITQSFTTNNTMTPGKSIEVGLVKGPFKKLNGGWQFQDEANGHCLITLDMSFEFKNRLLKMALEKVFNSIVNNLIQAFTDRAKIIYG